MADIATTSTTSTKPETGEKSRFIRRLLKRKTVAIGLVVLAIFVALAVLAPWIAPYSPSKLSIVNRLKPPSDINWFGTDEFGRDVFTRTLYAGRLSLLVGAAVVTLSAVLGVTLGLLAGFFKQLDTPIARLIDAMMAFPDILLAIALVAALGPSLATVIVALAIVYAPRLARIVRASTLVIRELPYVEAAKALGISTFHIMTRHVLRNLVSPILVQATFLFASAMLAEAGLSFLGLGVSPEVPTWGTMIAAGRQYVGQADWMTYFPGFAIILSVLSLQLVGDGLRDMLDPRLQRTL
jgi:peptide/nickel transport system permease protein